MRWIREVVKVKWKNKLNVFTCIVEIPDLLFQAESLAHAFN